MHSRLVVTIIAMQGNSENTSCRSNADYPDTVKVANSIIRLHKCYIAIFQKVLTSYYLEIGIKFPSSMRNAQLIAIDGL